MCVGNIGMTVIAGNEVLSAAEDNLAKAVIGFNSTLSHFTSGVVFQSYRVGSETLAEVRSIFFEEMLWLILHVGLRQDFAIGREGQSRSDDARLGLNDKFMVPYQRNVNFTGRKALLVK